MRSKVILPYRSVDTPASPGAERADCDTVDTTARLSAWARRRTAESPVSEAACLLVGSYAVRAAISLSVAFTASASADTLSASPAASGDTSMRTGVDDSARATTVTPGMIEEKVLDDDVME